MPAPIRPLQHPIRTLVSCFVVWKALLLAIAACSPGLGYDTSTSLILPSLGSDDIRDGGLPSILRYMVIKLTRWDAIYFVKVANRGYVFEQEWAWGWGFTRLIAACATGLEKAGIQYYDWLEGLVAVCIAHTAHLLSVLVLFSLTLAVFPRCSSGFAFTTASLHIISPAGIFLSAPYAESSCALLTFSGCLLFTKSFSSTRQPTVGHDFLILFSGILFGIATTFRSNGILNGMLLLEEACRALLKLKNSFQMTTIRRLAAVGLGGLFVAAGFLLPQYIAYREYCGHLNGNIVRPWCRRVLPSVYTFVQDHYWNVGLFRYWTLSNLPLFLLATPMMAIMIMSSFRALYPAGNELDYPLVQDEMVKNGSPWKNEPRQFSVLQNLAISQLLLASLTLTTAHVQIITRISSAYPPWLWYLAGSGGGRSIRKSFVTWIVIYAIVQAGLFSSFLPPA